MDFSPRRCSAAPCILLDRRPWLAGVLIGLLAYKPQFGVLIPIALLAGGRWRTIGAAIATVAALLAVSFATLGGGVWHAFAVSTTFTQTVVLEQGGTGWEKIQSIFSAVRMWGGSVPTGLCGADRAGADARRKPGAGSGKAMPRSRLKAAALATGSLLATPYVLDYDLVVLAVAIAFCVRHGLNSGFRDYEISLLAAAWIVPLAVARHRRRHRHTRWACWRYWLSMLLRCGAQQDRMDVITGARGIAQA